MLLGAPSDAGPAVAQERLHCTQARLQRLRAAAAQRRPADPVGGPRRAAAQRVPDGARARGQQPRGQGVGALHAKGRRRRREGAQAGCRVPGVGQPGAEALCGRQRDQASRAQERASEPVERRKGVCESLRFQRRRGLFFSADWA